MNETILPVVDNAVAEVLPVDTTPVLPVADTAPAEALPVVTPAAPKAKAKAKKTAKPAKPAKPKVGRPPVYTGLLLTYVVAVMIAVNKKFSGQGVSKTRAMLTLTGAERTAKAKEFGIDLRGIAEKIYGKKSVPDMTISGVTLVKIGKELAAKNKIVLSRGRPKLETADAS